MEKSVLSICNSNEIDTLASGLLTEAGKLDLASDLIITNVINELKVETDELKAGIEHTRGDVLRENLKKENLIADDDFVCYKQFVKANTFRSEADKAQDAMDLWELTVSHDLFLHKKSMEKQISLSNSLLANLESDKFKTKIDGLFGVAESIAKFKTSTASLEKSYQKVNETNASEVEVIAPSIQKNTVCKIINENLLPYLETSSKAIPEPYEKLFKKACEMIENINSKARARKTRNQKDIEEATIPQ
jgi:hypothetical protein